MSRIEKGTFLESKYEKGLFINVVKFDDEKIYSSEGDTLFAISNKDGKTLAYDPTEVLKYWDIVHPDNIPFFVYAEFWQLSRGLDIPSRNTPEWTSMYEQWVEYAFQDFGE